MTDLSFSSLPLAAGSALISGTSRAGGWALRRYMRAPLATSAILAMAGLSLLGATHALYFQNGRHPAPLFSQGTMHRAPVQELVAPRPAPPRPTQQHKSDISSIISDDVTGSVTLQAAAASPIGRDDVAAIQRKLASLDLFSGRFDGLYGPKTAKAIRAFQVKAGLTPRGTLDHAVMAVILATPVPRAEPAAAVAPQTHLAAAPTPAVLPAALQDQHVAAQPLALGPMPLKVATPQPRPQSAPAEISAAPQLRLASAPVSEQSLPPPVTRPAEPARDVKIGPVDGSPEQILDAAGSTAANAFNALAGMVADATGQSAQATAPAARPAARVATAAAVRRGRLQPEPAMDAASEPAVRVAESQPQQVEQQQVGQRDAPRMAATLAIPTVPTAVATAPVNSNMSSTDPVLVTKVQRGLASLGFLAGRIDGVASESTAKAVRNFEVYYNYPVTGRVTPELVGLLQQAGAVI